MDAWGAEGPGEPPPCPVRLPSLGLCGSRLRVCRARVGSLVSALRGSRGGGGSPVGSEGASEGGGAWGWAPGWGQCRRSLLAFSRLTWKERQTLSLFHLLFGVNCRLTGTCMNRFERPPAPVTCPPDATVLHSVPSTPCPHNLLLRVECGLCAQFCAFPWQGKPHAPPQSGFGGTPSCGPFKPHLLPSRPSPPLTPGGHGGFPVDVVLTF